MSLKKYQNNEFLAKNGPVVIGGVGGSGTRVIAEILSNLNFYLGYDLNEPKDLLLYTLLFKRKRWFYKNRTNEGLLQTGLELLQKLVISKKSLSGKELSYLLNAIWSMSVLGHNHLGHGKGIWPFIRVKKLLFGYESDLSRFIGWGWKEPNSHLLITEMDQHFENFKYILIIRHGLDMAFSKNQQQLYNWGPMFGVDLPKNSQEIPLASFQYWVKANKSALEKGEKLGQEKFLWINYDQLCADPKSGIQKLLSFLEIKADEYTIRKCSELPKVALSSGRFRNYDLGKFEDKDLAYVRSLGFVI
jgi:hypothetical protein